MLKESDFLKIASIPNDIWKKYQFMCSDSGQFIWFGQNNLSTIEVSGVTSVSLLGNFFLIEFNHSRIYLSLDEYCVQTTHYS